jgi:TRAP-type C4-dicarboxylate transport system substrate-binding protein
MAPEVLIMSPRAWESLSSEDQALFRTAAEESSAFMRDLWTQWEERSRVQARTNGNVIIPEFDRQAFQDAANAIFAAHSVDADTRQLIERIRQVQ